GVVAFANTAEGLLTGELKAPLPAGDYRGHFTRFQGENLVKNLAKVEVLKTMAREKGYTPARLAIAWVNAQGDDIMPLVSMSRRSRLPENVQALGIRFTPEEMEILNSHFAPGTIAGGTYLQR
ncbi:MAG TPA: aldo/keto reductase, partial [Puia sp.]